MRGGDGRLEGEKRRGDDGLEDGRGREEQTR